MADSIAERVQRRRNSHVEDEDTIVQAPEVSLGEKVLLCELIRDGILKHFNPCKLSDLQYVLELRCFKGLVSDEDLKEMYFKRAWGVPGVGCFRTGHVAGVVGGGDAERGSGKRSRRAFPGHLLVWLMCRHSTRRSPSCESTGRWRTCLVMSTGTPCVVHTCCARSGRWASRTWKETTVGDCLVGACGAGMDLSLLSTLVGTHGANVDAVDRWGKTALMLAA